MFMPVWDVGLFDLVDGCGFVEFGLSGCVCVCFFFFFFGGGVGGCGFVSVVDVRWWCGFVSVWSIWLFFFFFLRLRWWPSAFVPVVAVGDDEEDSDRDRENIIYYFNV